MRDEDEKGAVLVRLQAGFAKQGRLEWIGLRPAYRVPIEEVERAVVLAGHGLAGDRAVEGSGSGKRNVTLIQSEHLPVVAALLGAAARPEWRRRDLVVSGINLVALKDRRLRVGKVLLEGTGARHPCSRMEGALGVGGYAAMRGHGSITARALTGGEIRVGDAVVAVDDAPAIGASSS